MWVLAPCILRSLVAPHRCCAVALAARGHSVVPHSKKLYTQSSQYARKKGKRQAKPTDKGTHVPTYD